jgi:hypothetical protein
VCTALTTAASGAAGFDQPATGQQVLLVSVATGLSAFVAFSQLPDNNKTIDVLQPGLLKKSYARVLSKRLFKKAINATWSWPTGLRQSGRQSGYGIISI